MDDIALKKKLLNGKKDDRIIFAVTPEFKTALQTVAEEKCTTVSALLTDLATTEILDNKNCLSQ